MSSLTVQEAQAKLSELIHNMKPGDEVVITENDEPVAIECGSIWEFAIKVTLGKLVLSVMRTSMPTESLACGKAI